MKDATRKVKFAGSRLHQALEHELPNGGEAVVALSGGMDSQVLLHLALANKPERISISALHVDHGLNEQSRVWAKRCVSLCTEWGTSCEVVRVMIAKVPAGLENRARAARLEACKEHSGKVVLMAHHADDQAETVMLRMLRGSGVHGLGAMRMVTDFPGAPKRLLRPLLECNKAELAEYAEHHGIVGIEDPDNKNELRNRNWLRHVVLPEAEKRFPGAHDALVRSALQAAEASLLLDALADDDDLRCQTPSGYDRFLLAELGISRVRNWLRRALHLRGVRSAKARHLEVAAAQLCSASRSFEQSFGDLCLQGEKNRLIWQKIK